MNLTYEEIQNIPSDLRGEGPIEFESLKAIRRGEIPETTAMNIPADEWATRLAHCDERIEAYDRLTDERNRAKERSQ
jgi:hypothetical protein